MNNIFLVALGGCSSSGKSTLAKGITEICPEITLLQEDDFYKHDDQIPFDKRRRISNWDSPEALDLDLFKRELDRIRETGHISSQLVHNNNVDDLSKFKLDTGVLQRLKDRLELACRIVKIVIVEGFMIYNDLQLSAKFDLKLFVRAPYEVLKARRKARPGYETLDSYWVDPPYYFDEFVYNSYKSSHAFLFIDGNVEGSLNPKTASNLKEFINYSETPFIDALDWATNEICKAVSIAH